MVETCIFYLFFLTLFGTFLLAAGSYMWKEQLADAFLFYVQLNKLICRFVIETPLVFVRYTG